MTETRAASRYAGALLGLAEETKQFDAVSKDFEYLGGLIRGSKELVLFLKSPVINKEKKTAVIAALFKGKVTGLTLDFLNLIAAKGRETILPEIIRQFSVIRDEHLGILKATVRTAVPITASQRDKLAEQLKRVTKMDIHLVDVEDKTLIGGVTVQFDDTVWDGSLRHQLELMRERFILGGA